MTEKNGDGVSEGDVELVRVKVWYNENGESGRG